MKFHGALIKERDVTFAIVKVKPQVNANSEKREKMRNTFKKIFPNVPIVLMSEEKTGKATYSGRKDLVQFLARIKVSQIPWKEYTVR